MCVSVFWPSVFPSGLPRKEKEAKTDIPPSPQPPLARVSRFVHQTSFHTVPHTYSIGLSIRTLKRSRIKERKKENQAPSKSSSSRSLCRDHDKSRHAYAALHVSHPIDHVTSVLVVPQLVSENPDMLTCRQPPNGQA